MKNIIWIVVAFIIGFVIAWFTHINTHIIPGKEIVKTVIEPGKIIYINKPQPTPIIIEKIVKDNSIVSFKADLNYTGKQIKSDSVTQTFDGVYHLSIVNNVPKIDDQITSNITTTYKYKIKSPPLNELGPFISTFGAGLYYRRYFNDVLFISPSAEIGGYRKFDNTYELYLRGNLPTKW